MIGDDIRQHGLRSITSYSEPKKKRMSEIYGILAQALPDDPAAGRYQKVLAQAKSSKLMVDTRRVLSHLMLVAEVRHQQQLNRQSKQPRLQIPKNNDIITESYVRQAALASQRIKSDQASKAFLLALGIFLDDSETLRKFPPTSRFVTRTEDEHQRNSRLEILGQPTLDGRRDLAQHFFVSAFLTASLGAKSARAIGLSKELNDARQGSGFSFNDMVANRAGVMFAEHLLEGKIRLRDLADRFTCNMFFPSLENLPGKLSSAELENQFGSPDGSKLSEEITRLENLIRALPVYQSKGTKSQSSLK